jgi:hypothetical protein
MLTCKVGNTIINCFNEQYDKYTLKQWSDKNRLICPDCGKPYEYCHGEIVSPYFRHKEKSECDMLYHESETEEHIKGKISLYNWLLNLQEQSIIQNVKLESYIPETRQRPDLYFEYNGDRYVIEYQCSPIASEFLERRELYKLARINDIWILGTDKFINKSETKKWFKNKVIEKYSNYYYDSIYNIFMFSSISNLQIDNKEMINSTKLYYDKNTRDNSVTDMILIDSHNNKYIISFNHILFNVGNFEIIPKIIKNTNTFTENEKQKQIQLGQRLIQAIHTKINEKQEQLKLESSFVKNKSECKKFLENLLQNLEEKFDMHFYFMPSIELGFKYSGRYFNLSNLSKYPILDFNRIRYIDNNIIEEFIFNINIHDTDAMDKIINYLNETIISEIKYQRELYEKKILEEEIERQEIEKINHENELKLLNTKIYFVDGNFNIKTKILSDFSINNIINFDHEYESNWEMDRLITFLKRSKKEIQYILVKKTLRGQSISNRCRNKIITKLKDYGFNDVSFYEEDIDAK